MHKRLLALLALISWVGCSGDEISGLMLIGFHGLKAEEEGCTYVENPTSSSTYDVAIAGEYGVPLNVFVHLRNELVGMANPEVGRVETHRITVRSLRVAFEGEGWLGLPDPIEIPVTGVVIEPNGSYWTHVTPLRAREAKILNRQFSNAEGEVKELRLRLRFFGETMDGTRVESNELSHTVHVCRDCLGCPPGQVMTAACAMAYAQPDGIACVEVENQGG